MSARCASIGAALVLAIVSCAGPEGRAVTHFPASEAHSVPSREAGQRATPRDGVEMVFRPQSYECLASRQGCGIAMHWAHVLATRVAWSDAELAPSVDQTVLLHVPCLDAVRPGQCISVRVSRGIALVAVANDWSEPLVVEAGRIVPCLFAPDVREVRPWRGTGDRGVVSADGAATIRTARDPS